MSKQITRYEKYSDGYRLISNDKLSDIQDVLSEIDSSLGIYFVSDSKARVFWCGQTYDSTDWEFKPENIVYYEQDIIKRDLEPEEIEWVNNTYMFDVDSIDCMYEINIPDPKELKKSLKEFNDSKYDNIDYKIRDRESCSFIMNKTQTKIAELSYIENQIRTNGKIHNIPGKYDYRKSDSITRDEIKNKVITRKDAHLTQWSDLFGISYYIMKRVRYNCLDIDYPYSFGIDKYKHIEKDLINLNNISQCEVCLCAMPKEKFLNIPIKSSSGSVMVCDDCADLRKDHLFGKQDINKAKDDRAKKINGQRTLNGDYNS